MNAKMARQLFSNWKDALHYMARCVRLSLCLIWPQGVKLMQGTQTKASDGLCADKLRWRLQCFLYYSFVFAAAALTRINCALCLTCIAHTLLALEFFYTAPYLYLVSRARKLSIWYYWRGKCVGWKSGREIFRQWALERRRRAGGARLTHAKASLSCHPARNLGPQLTRCSVLWTLINLCHGGLPLRERLFVAR